MSRNPALKGAFCSC